MCRFEFTSLCKVHGSCDIVDRMGKDELLCFDLHVIMKHQATFSPSILMAVEYRTLQVCKYTSNRSSNDTRNLFRDIVILQCCNENSVVLVSGSGRFDFSIFVVH